MPLHQITNLVLGQDLRYEILMTLDVIRLDDFPGIQRNVPLKGFSTFGVGGPARYFYTLDRTDDLKPLLHAAHNAHQPVFILGGGSNVLFLDEGFPGLMIRMATQECSVEGDKIVADAGVKWPTIFQCMTETGLTGLEPFQGLPGTVGGAVRGNAGCFGVEMKDFVETVLLYDLKSDSLKTVDADFLEFGYRTSRLKKEPAIVLRVVLNLEKSAPKKHSLELDAHQNRLMHQPPGKSSGSFFKNPSPDQPAGQLIDACGLKGLTIGDAQISPKHANFFMNLGHATAADILALRDRAKSAVKEKFGIALEEEVGIARASC